MKPRPRLLFLTWMFVHSLNLRDLEFPKVLKMAVWVCCCAAKERDWSCVQRGGRVGGGKFIGPGARLPGSKLRQQDLLNPSMPQCLHL